jgi:hypothetical protein
VCNRAGGIKRIEEFNKVYVSYSGLVWILLDNKMIYNVCRDSEKCVFFLFVNFPLLFPFILSQLRATEESISLIEPKKHLRLPRK